MDTHVGEQETIVSTSTPMISRRVAIGAALAASVIPGGDAAQRLNAAEVRSDQILEAQAQTISTLVKQEEALWTEVARCIEILENRRPEPNERLLSYSWNGRPLLFKSVTGQYHTVDSVVQHVLNLDTSTWTIGEPRDSEVAEALKAWRTACEEAARGSGEREAQARFDAFVDEGGVAKTCKAMAARPAAGIVGFSAKLKALRIIGRAEDGLLCLSDWIGEGAYGESPDLLALSALNDAARLLGQSVD